jgi:hypothetical protein
LERVKRRSMDSASAVPTFRADAHLTIWSYWLRTRSQSIGLVRIVDLCEGALQARPTRVGPQPGQGGLLGLPRRCLVDLVRPRRRTGKAVGSEEECVELG